MDHRIRRRIWCEPAASWKICHDQASYVDRINGHVRFVEQPSRAPDLGFFTIVTDPGKWSQGNIGRHPHEILSSGNSDNVLRDVLDCIGGRIDSLRDSID